MSENDEKKAQEIDVDFDVTDLEDKKSQKKKSFMENYREINEREQRELLDEESRKTEEKAEKERLEREAYSKKLAQDKLELMKLRSGIISEDDIPKEIKIEKVYSRKEKITNFFYHYKAHVIVTTFIVVLAGFLIHDLVTQVKPDVSIMLIATDPQFFYQTEKMAEVFEQYCEDYNGDGKINVRVSYIPGLVDEDNSANLAYSQADQTKLVAEFQSVDSIAVIADYETVEYCGLTEGVFIDFKTLYPDDENAVKLGYMLKGTNFAKDIEYTDLAQDIFLALREPHGGFGVNEEKFNKNYENAYKMFDNYLKGNIVNPVEATETSK